MTTDSELAVLQKKIERLTQDRDTAMRMAERSSLLLREMKSQTEHYRKLWEFAEKRTQKSVLPDVSHLEGIVMPETTKKKRTVSDWIWTAVFVGGAAVVVYVLGWVLVWPGE